jgi:hypothetical protein
MSLATNLSLIAVSGFGNSGNILTSRGSTITPVFSAVGGGNLLSLSGINGLAVTATTGNVTISSNQIELLSAFNYTTGQSDPNFPGAWLSDPQFKTTTPISMNFACGNYTNYRRLSSYGAITINKNTNFIFVIDGTANFSGNFAFAGDYPYYFWKQHLLRYAIGPSFNTFYPLYVNPQVTPNVISKLFSLGYGLCTKTYGTGITNIYGSGSIELSAGSYIFDLQSIDIGKFVSENITALNESGTLMIYKK